MHPAGAYDDITVDEFYEDINQAITDNSVYIHITNGWLQRDKSDISHKGEA